jgi:transcriptional regulator with XRE-family HTH domain
MSTRGARLIEAMKLRGMQKQHALAYSLGVNESTVTRWKNNGPMSLESAIALSHTLDISLDWFLIGTGSIARHEAKANLAFEDEQLWAAVNKIAATMTAQSKLRLIAFLDSVLPH